jgi:hypothetical protein
MARLSRPLGRDINRSAQALFLPIRAVADIRCATRFEAFCRTRFRWSAAIAQSVEHVIRKNDGSLLHAIAVHRTYRTKLQ